MKNRKNLLWILPLLFSAACASKTLKQEGPTPEGATPSAPQEFSAAKTNRIVLVVGGTGVASYATVGLLKKFYEEGMETEAIISTGWPTVFALADGFLKSVHDLEWFATRLDAKDFEKIGSIDFRRDIEPASALPAFVISSFPQNLLNQSRIPVIIAATNTDLGEPDVFSSGEWKEPLLRTLSVPGVYRKYPAERGTSWMDGVQALDVREALRRGASTIVAVSMYDDFIHSLNQSRGGKDDELFRRLYAVRLKKTSQEAMKQASLSASIVLNKEPTDFSAKRSAILAGYKEGARLIKRIRQTAPAANPN